MLLRQVIITNWELGLNQDMKTTGGVGFTGFIKVNCKLSRRQQDTRSLLSLWVQYN